MTVDSADFDAILDLCQHQHRRAVLTMLGEQRRSATLDELTEAVLEYDRQTPRAETSEDRREIRISLYHIHLPKLAAEGLIHYDPENELVEPSEQFEQVQPTLSRIIGADSALDTVKQ